MKFNFESPTPGDNLAPDNESMGFLDHAGDIGFGVVRGGAGAVASIWDLADWVAGDYLPDVPDNLGLGKSKTLAGGLVEGISQFMVGFVPGLNVASWAGRVTKVSSKIGKAIEAADAVGNVKKVNAIKWGTSFGKSVTAGAVADFTVFDAQEERLSNLLQQFPALQNPVTDFLAADKDDTEISGRLKNLLEGGILGGAMEPFVVGLRALRAGRKARLTGQDADKAMKKVLEKPKPKEEPKPTESMADDLVDGGGDTDPLKGGTPLAPNYRPEGDLDASVDSSTKELGEYTKKLEDKYGGTGEDLVPKIHHSERRKLMRLRAAANLDPSGIKRGATKPSEGFPLNQETTSVYQGINETLDAVVRTGDEDYANALKTQEMSRAEIENKARQEMQANEDAGLGRMSMHDIDGFDDDTLIKITVRLRSLRNQHEGYLRLMNEYEQAAFGGSDVHKVTFLNARQMAEKLQAEIKRTQEGIGRALQSMQMKGSGEVNTRSLIPENLRNPENVEAQKFSEDVLKELGGGDVVKGRQIVERDIERLRRIKEANKHLKDGGNAKVLAHLGDQVKWPEMFTEYWLNAILSGPITHMVNMTSNSLNTLFLPMEQALGKLTSFDLQGAQEAIGLYTHLWSSFTDAAKAAGDTFRTGEVKVDTHMGPIDTPRSAGRALRSDNKTLDFFGALANVPSRALITSDSFFKNLNYRAQVRAGLAKEGVAANKTGARLAAHIEEGMQKIISDGQFYSYRNVRLRAYELAESHKGIASISDPTKRNRIKNQFVSRYMRRNFKKEYGALANKAREYGREVTYTQSLDDPGRGPLVQVAAKWNKVVNAHPGLRIVTPFVRTPTNLVSFFLNRTIGAHIDILKIGGSSIKNMKLVDAEMVKALTNKSPSEIKGRFLTGSLFMFGAGVAFNNGNITGGGPKDPEKRRLMQASGWQPYSIRVGDKWVSYQRMDPFANFLGVIADIGEGIRESDEEDVPMWESVLGNATMAMAKNIASKSYLTGIARVSNVLANPDRYASKYLEQTAASFLPFSSFAGQTWGAAEHQQEIRGVIDAMRAKYGLTGAGTL